MGGIRIVATDGEDTITLGFINCGKQYVFGQVTEDPVGDPSHYTYHENGYMHYKRRADTPNPVIHPTYYGPPLDDFRGFVSAGMMAVEKQVGRIVSPDFYDTSRGYDNITYIDVRNSPHGKKYQPFICEPGFSVAQWVKQIKSSTSINPDVPPNFSYQIYTDVDPWVGVAHWEQASAIHGLGATRNFRPMGRSVDIKADRDPYPRSCPQGNFGCDGPNGSGPLCMGCYETIK